jgi:hypothetical protein
MVHWNTDGIKKWLQDALPHLVITSDEAGGDYDTSLVILKVPGVDDSIHLCGFNSANPLRDKDDALCEAFELRNQHSDSGGGCCSDNEDVHDAYNAVKKLLRLNGYLPIVDNLRDYF